jgi:hypothetical protein
MALTSRFSPVIHLNRNERLLESIKTRLDEAYRELLFLRFLRHLVAVCSVLIHVASTLRLEGQQTQIAIQQTRQAIQQTETRRDLKNLSCGTVSVFRLWTRK